VGEGGFAEAWGAAEQEVVEGLGAGSGRIEKDAEAVFEFRLAGKVGEPGGAERLVDGVARGNVEFFERFGRHGGRMAEGGKFESGKVGRYAHIR